MASAPAPHAGRKFRVKGKITDKRGQPVANIRVKAYDENGSLLGTAATNSAGLIEFESGTRPATIKVVDHSSTILTKPIDELAVVQGIVDIGVVVLYLTPPAEWHIRGVVKDKMTGDPLPGLTVEIMDVDTSVSGGPYYDPLGEVVTNATGQFNVWFDGVAFEREATWTGEKCPDVLIKVKNTKGVIIYEGPIDQNVTGTPHICKPYLAHKGKDYIIEIDYVTATINKIGQVPVSDINSSGRATFQGITDRPFSGFATIYGRIWGAKVNKWKLYYSPGFVDSNDTRFNGLGPASPDPTGFTKLAEGTNKVWDGPIHKWTTTGLDSTHTAILVVWDLDGNEYHDTQLLFFHNTVITPAAQIVSPAPGANISKASGPSVELRGNASDDYFLGYHLYWAGPTQTELTDGSYTPPPGGWNTAVLNGKLADFEIASKPVGPYLLRLEVWDRAIQNDGYPGGGPNIDWTWNTVTITG